MKSQITLLPPKGILAAAEVMTLANTPNKHSDEKWKTMTPTTHVDAALRHLYAWLSGESRDPDLGTSHLANAATRLLMATSQEADEKAINDDRARYTHAEEAPLPAPVQPEYEAWLDGKLPDSPVLTSEHDAFDKDPARWQSQRIYDQAIENALFYMGFTNTEIAHLKRLPNDSPAHQWALDKINAFKQSKTPEQGIDSIKPEQWDAANTSFLAAQRTNRRYLEAMKAQRAGDDE